MKTRYEKRKAAKSKIQRQREKIKELTKALEYYRKLAELNRKHIPF